jgi:hypothetical protein
VGDNSITMAEKGKTHWGGEKKKPSNISLCWEGGWRQAGPCLDNRCVSPISGPQNSVCGSSDVLYWFASRHKSACNSSLMWPGLIQAWWTAKARVWGEYRLWPQQQHWGTSLLWVHSCSSGVWDDCKNSSHSSGVGGVGRCGYPHQQHIWGQWDYFRHVMFASSFLLSWSLLDELKFISLI